VVEPKKKRKSTVVDSSDDDAPPAKRSKTKLKRKSSGWKFIAHEAEASDMESDSEELRANDADHAFTNKKKRHACHMKTLGVPCVERATPLFLVFYKM